MQLFVAVKHGPLALSRDAITHVPRYRFDRMPLVPAFLRRRFPVHVEIVIIAACTNGVFCEICRCTKTSTVQTFEGRHYLTYSVDLRRGVVFLSIGRHITPPEVLHDSNESWVYHKIPLDDAAIVEAMNFLQKQLGKPVRDFYRVFACCCLLSAHQTGSVLEDRANMFDDVTEWFCSELAAATLLCCYSEFQSGYNPGETSPCRLDGILVNDQLVTQYSSLAQLAWLPLLVGIV